jgi:3-oxoacyl-[acyl-carrier protein] reductase
MIDLFGRRVLVTGGSRGIGAACCRLFAEAGAAVLVHYHRDREAAEAAVAALPPPSGEAHQLFRADLASAAGADALVQFARDEWGSLDCLVNNAGIWVRNPLSELDRDEMEATWQLNLSGVFRVSQLAVPLLRESEDGNIVNITSTAGQRGEAFYSPYAASKGALIAATKSWSTELAPGVRVNSVAPGWVDTDMSASAYADGGRERIAAEIPLRRIATAEDIAGAVLFLASPLARHVTGEILNVNGGSVLAG